MTGPVAHVVFDLGFGDAGKGRLVDALCRRAFAAGRAPLVVRAHGGAQAGHNVVAPDGRHHTFSSLGAGSFVPGVGTHLGPAFVLHPLALVLEARVLAGKGVPEPLARVTIDARCRVTTPFQQAAGRLRELARGPDAHGTCGVGVGETVADALRFDDVVTAADLRRPTLLRRRLAAQQARARADVPRDLPDPRADPELTFLDDPRAVDRVVAAWAEAAAALRLVDPDEARARLSRAPTLVFEGAQGVLLDEEWGFHPHTTWSDCTPRAALALLPDGRPVTRWAVTRTYAIRHGPGPFPAEDPEVAFPEPHNGDDGWQGAFRRAPLDGVLLRYALEVAGGADALAVTHLDRARDGLPWTPRWADGTTRLDPGAPGDLAHRGALGWRVTEAGRVSAPLPGPTAGEVLAEHLAVPLRFTSHGPRTGEERWL